MTSDTRHSYQLRTAQGAVYLVVGSLLLLLAYGALVIDVEPFWILLAVPVLLLIPVLVQRFPVFIMATMVYIGTFKTHGAVGMSMTDPTLVTAGLLYAAMILQVLLLAMGGEGYNLRDLFVEQWLGVAAFTLLILVIAISYAYTPAPQVGGEKVLRLITFDFPIFLAPLILLRTEGDVRQLVLLSMAGSLFLAARTLSRLLHPSADLLLGIQDPTEIGPGLLMGAAALIALYYPFPEKRFFRVSLISCLLALACGTTASLSRSAIISLLLVVVASVIFLRHVPTALSRKAVFVGVAGVVMAVSVAAVWLSHLPATHSKFTEKAGELSLTLQGIYPPAGTAGQRYSFSESAWHAFLSKPLLGWGAGGWSTLWHYSDDERVLRYPHNFVLEIAAEQGLAGLAVLTLLLLTMLNASAKVLSGPDRRFVFIVPVVVLCLLSNAVTGQVESREMWFWCGTLFAMARLARASLPSEAL